MNSSTITISMCAVNSVCFEVTWRKNVMVLDDGSSFKKLPKVIEIDGVLFSFGGWVGHNAVRYVRVGQKTD